MTGPGPAHDAMRLESERLRRAPRTTAAAALADLLTQLIAAIYQAYLTPPDSETENTP